MVLHHQYVKAWLLSTRQLTGLPLSGPQVLTPAITGLRWWIRIFVSSNSAGVIKVSTLLLPIVRLHPIIYWLVLSGSRNYEQTTLAGPSISSCLVSRQHLFRDPMIEVSWPAKYSLIHNITYLWEKHCSSNSVLSYLYLATAMSSTRSQLDSHDMAAARRSALMKATLPQPRPCLPCTSRLFFSYPSSSQDSS